MLPRKSRGTIRPLPANVDFSDVKTRVKRRISFSGKNSVRIFSEEEEPKTWNNSYEILDRISGNETATNCIPSKTRKLQKVRKDSYEDFDKSLVSENFQMCKIENSVDITLSESEKKFKIANLKNNDTAFSFSLDDHEKNYRSTVFVEKTIDFMRELNESNEKVNNSNMLNFEDAKVLVCNEYMDKNPCHDITCNKGVDVMEPKTVVMNDTLSISSNEQTSINNINPDKRKTINQATSLQLSPTTEKQFHKENVTQIANETQNNSCQMEIDEEILWDSQSSERLTAKFHPPNCINQQTESAIEFSPKSNEKIIQTNDVHSGLNINLNQFVQDVVQSSRANGSNKNGAIPKTKSRSTIYFNEPLEISPIKPGTAPKKINLSQSTQVDTENSTVREFNRDEYIFKLNSRPTIYFNQTLEISPLKLKNDLNRKTLNLNEDINVLSEKLSQEPLCSEDLNVSGCIIKYSQQPKIVFRKICGTNISKTNNLEDLEQQKLERYRDKQKQNTPPDALENNSKIVEAEKTTKTNTSLSFSLDSIENMTLSLESFSPLIPIEYKCYSLKQLNDEIEHGNLQVFSNAPKTPLTDRKGRNDACIVRLKSLHSTQSPLQNRRTLIFDDEAIPVSFDGTLYNKSNNFLHLNTKEDGLAKGRTNSGKCRYSQADDVMLDNTSFLTKAKLSDETVSRNNSKRDVSQIKDFINISIESLPNNTNKVDESILRPGVTIQKSCKKENYSSNSWFQNFKPISTQAIADIQNSINSINSSDDMNISKDMTKDFEKNEGGNNLHSGQTLPLESEECKKLIRQTMYFDNDVVESDFDVSREAENLKSTKNITQPKYMPIRIGKNPTSKTLYFEESTINDQNLLEKKATTIEKVVRARNTDVDSSYLNPSRKTLFFNNEISVQNLSSKTEINNQAEKSDIVNMSIEGNVPSLKNDRNNYNSTYIEKTLYFNNENPLEEKSDSIPRKNIQMDENFVFHESAEPSISGKIALSHRLNKSKLSNKFDNNLITPKKLIGSKISSFNCLTPRLSLLEFTSLEKWTEKEERETNYKRSSFTLTPVFSEIKKRHTLVFDHCTLNDLEQFNRQRPEFINKRCVNEDAMEMSGIRSNESSIPLSINKSLSLLDSSNNNQSVVLTELEMDAENFAESIQLIRMARPDNANVPGESPNDKVIREKMENTRLNESNFNSKYSEETFLNEKYFTLPELPPTPHLRLDRLGRLLERQAVMDDIVFWEREIFDCTTANYYDDTQLISNSDNDLKDDSNAITKAIKKYEENILSFEMNFLKFQHETPSASRLPFVFRLDALLRNNATNWIFDYQMQYRGILLFTHKKTLTLVLCLSFEEADKIGYDISFKSIKLGKSNIAKKNWKPIDFFLEFQLKLNLPYSLQWLLKGNTEVDVFKMLKEIDQVCLETLKMANSLQRICYTNQASIVRYGGRTCVHKIVREIETGTHNDSKCVKKTEINIELLNLKTLSFKDILTPRLHHFREEIHLLPTGLPFLQAFLPDPLYFLKVG